MAHRTNYKRERANRAEAKAAKREAKREARAAKAASTLGAPERDASENAEVERLGVNDDNPDPEVEI